MFSLSMVVLEVRGFLPYQPVCPPSRLATSYIPGTVFTSINLILTRELSIGAKVHLNLLALKHLG